MSASRLIALLGVFGALAGELAPQITPLNPKWGHIIAAVGLVLTMMNERVQGGTSRLPTVEMTTVTPVNTVSPPIAPTVAVEQNKK